MSGIWKFFNWVNNVSDHLISFTKRKKKKKQKASDILYTQRKKERINTYLLHTPYNTRGK